MAPSTDSPLAALQQPGGLARLIAAASNAYLVFMIGYLALRLIWGGGLWWLALLNTFAFYTFSPLLVLLPLATLASLWRHVIRLGFFAILGVIWFGPFFQPPAVPRPSGDPVLRVVTFNLRDYLNGHLDEFEAWLREIDADLVLLQEMPPAYREDGFPALRDLYPHQIDQGAGRYLLSRYPVDESAINQPRRTARAVIDMAGQPIAVYNVHFELPVRNNPRFGVETDTMFGLTLNYDETERNAQIDALLDAVEGETLPYIIAGDFNMSQHSIIYSSLAVIMTDSFRAAHVGLGATWPASFIGFPLLRLDYVWHSSAFRTLDCENGPNLGSDHLPVIATLELRPEAATKITPEATPEATAAPASE